MHLLIELESDDKCIIPQNSKNTIRLCLHIAKDERIARATMSEFYGRLNEQSDIDDEGLAYLDHEYLFIMANQRGARAISRLESDRSDKNDNDDRGAVLYMQLVDTMVEYLYRTLGMDEEEALGLVMDMTDHEIMPSLTMCQQSPLTSIEHARLAAFTGLAPIMMHLQGSESFTKWLPEAIKVATAHHETHDSRCIDNDQHCYDNFCPARSIAEVALEAVYMPDYGQYSYELDKMQAYDNLRLLLATLHDQKLISQKLWAELDGCAAAKFATTFVSGKDVS